MIVSFVFAVHRVGGEGERDPAEGERRSERRAAEAPADEEQAEDDQQVEGDRRRVRRRKRVPLARPAEREHGGDVGEVGDRPVRVAASVGASQRPFVWMWSRIAPSRVGGAARRGRRSSGMWPYGAWPSRIRSAPITPARPDVDHPARRLEVEADPQAAEEDGEPREQPDGPARAPGSTRRPRKPIHDVRTRRYAAAARRADALMKMWPRLKNSSENPKESSAEQVGRVPRADPSPVDEPEEEDDAERRPHPPGVEDLAAERRRPALAPSPTRPAGRCTPPITRPSRIVDLPERDLAGAPRPHHAPSTAASPCRTSHRSAGSAGSARASARPWDGRGTRR